jgi:beta-glucosidase
MDLPSLALPENQDETIRQVARANPHTIVVLETGTATLMPWIDNVSAVAEAWYGGTNAAQAVARVLVGEVNPSGHLPITFPKSESDLPHPVLTPPPPKSTTEFYGASGEEHDRAGLPKFDVNYSEGLLVGYKWYAAKGKPVRFPFGYGLSYTTFAYSGLKVAPDGRSARVTVSNTGTRSGRAVAQLYASLPPSTEEPDRLAGWAVLTLLPKESREVTIAIEPLSLAVYDLQSKGFAISPGRFKFHVGSSSFDLPTEDIVSMEGQRVIP